MSANMRNRLNGLVRTWPYGTQKRVKVLHVEATVLVVCDEDNEGFILADEFTNGLSVGDSGTITFTECGPTGAHWRFHREGGKL